MFPDIQVRDRQGQIQCAIEIGYTRPEKLTAYRQKFKIPDVRWYDKQGNLHADVTERIVRVSMQLVPEGEFTIWEAYAEVPCYEDDCTGPMPPEEELDLEEHESYEDYYEDWQEECHSYVWTLAVTNYSFVWIVSYCDKCDRVWVQDREEADMTALWCSIKEMTPLELAKTYTRVFRGGWAEACAYAKDEFHGFELKPEDSIPLHNRTRNDMEMVRLTERKISAGARE